MKEALAALGVIFLVMLLTGGGSCSFGVNSRTSRTHTCIERSSAPLMDKKYECTEAELKAQREPNAP